MPFYCFSLQVLICASFFSTRKREFSELNLRFTVCIFTGSVRDALIPAILEIRAPCEESSIAPRHANNRNRRSERCTELAEKFLF
jgi:hypothetical protein